MDECKYKVVEMFVSINGEGRKAGQLAVFIRLAGCNLDCTYCDTKWANTPDVEYELMTADSIYAFIKETKVKNVTITGGEPLLQAGIEALLQKLAEDEELSIEIETNGSIDVNQIRYADGGRYADRYSFTIDYKCPISGMEEHMDMENFKNISSVDTVKFVVGSVEDMQVAKKVIDEYSLSEKAAVYLSPVFGKIKPEDMVTFMKDHNMNGVNLQLQLHKYIWDPNKTGV